MISSPVIRGRIKEGESHKDDLSHSEDHDLKLATLSLWPTPSCILPASGEDMTERHHVPKCAPITAAASSFAFSPWLRNRVSEKKPWMVPG